MRNSKDVLVRLQIKLDFRYGLLQKERGMSFAPASNIPLNK